MLCLGGFEPYSRWGPLYLGKKNPIYQQETTIRHVVNVSFFTYQVAVNFCESFNVVFYVN